MKFSGVWAALCAGVLCSAPAAARNDDPAQAYAALEARLLSASHVLIEARVQARGAVTADLRGRAEFNPRNRMALNFSGALAGATRELALQSDGVRTLLASAPRRSEEPVRPETNYALLLGFARMGLLHNLSRLANLEAPEGASGGAGRRLTVEEFRHGTYALSGPLEGAFAFGFDLLLDGRIVGTERVWLDPASGLPRRREETLQSPQGEVSIVEDYDRVVIE
jgi:hypothetical protein